MSEQTNQNREAWLQRAIEALRGHFEECGYPLAERVHVSCSWPSTKALSKKGKRLGEVWPASLSEDGVPSVYISPLIWDSCEVLGVLVHELGHTALPEKSGHGPRFKAFMQKVGLVGKATATALGPELEEDLKRMVAGRLGEYPHSKLLAEKLGEKEKGQKGRHLKIMCVGGGSEDLHQEYTLRGTEKVFAMGLPTCPVCGEQMDREEKKEEDDDWN